MESRFSCSSSQSGQALAEALVALIVVVALWQGVAWLARIQDLALNAHHAARYGAFATTRNPAMLKSDADTDMRFLAAQRLQWVDQQGRWLLPQRYHEPQLKVARGAALPEDAQPGQSHQHSHQLRTQWQISERGVAVSGLSLEPRSTRGPWPRLHREVAIAVGAGHTSSDADTVQRIRQSSLGWSDTVHASIRLGQQVESGAAGTDQGWGRSLPDFDWLAPWAEEVPAHLIKPGRDG